MDELRRLFEYNRWANLRFLDAADELAPEEFLRELRSSFPSVRETLIHLIGAEWVWLSRWQGTSPTGFPEASELTSIQAIRDRWDALWEDQQAFLEGLTPEAESRPVHYRLFSGEEDEQTLGELMRHVINHATYHRGQLVTFLRQLGRTPPSTDYIRFLREASA